VSDEIRRGSSASLRGDDGERERHADHAAGTAVDEVVIGRPGTPGYGAARRPPRDDDLVDAARDAGFRHIEFLWNDGGCDGVRNGSSRRALVLDIGGALATAVRARRAAPRIEKVRDADILSTRERVSGNDYDSCCFAASWRCSVLATN
jgi:hypothetical protein